MKPAPSTDYIRAYMAERAVDAARSALLIIYMQYATGSRQGALARTLKSQGSATGDYRFDRIEQQVLPHTIALRERVRALGRPVLHVTVGAAQPDAVDAPIHMRKLFVEFANHVGSREHEIRTNSSRCPANMCCARRRSEPSRRPTSTAAAVTGLRAALPVRHLDQYVCREHCARGGRPGLSRHPGRRRLWHTHADLHDVTMRNFQRLFGRVRSTSRYVRVGVVSSAVATA